MESRNSSNIFSVTRSPSATVSFVIIELTRGRNKEYPRKTKACLRDTRYEREPLSPRMSRHATARVAFSRSRTLGLVTKTLSSSVSFIISTRRKFQGQTTNVRWSSQARNQPSYSKRRLSPFGLGPTKL